jgi:hypothetical protein
MKEPFLGRGGERREEKRREGKRRGIKDFDRRTFWGVWELNIAQV